MLISISWDVPNFSLTLKIEADSSLKRGIDDHRLDTIVPSTSYVELEVDGMFHVQLTVACCNLHVRCSKPPC